MFPPKKQPMAADPEMDAVGALMAGGDDEAPIEEEAEEKVTRKPEELLAEVETLLGELRAAVGA